MVGFLTLKTLLLITVPISVKIASRSPKSFRELPVVSKQMCGAFSLNKGCVCLTQKPHLLSSFEVLSLLMLCFLEGNYRKLCT